MNANRSRFDSLNSFIKRRHRAIVVAWVLALIVSAPFISSFFSSISFNAAGGGGLSVPNSESEKAQTIISDQFPATSASAGTGPIIVVFQNQDVYSNAVKADILSLNRTLAADPKSGGFTGILGLYSEEGSLLDSTVPFYLAEIAQIAGRSPNSANSTAAWDSAAEIFANETSTAFASSPLFTINATSLYNLLSGLRGGSTQNQVRASVANLLSTDSLVNYPYRLSPSITKNFVSPDNGTMIFELGFSSTPNASVIIQTRAAVHGSSLAKLGTIFVTGAPVLTVDFSNTAQPALTDSILPGLAISLLVAGLLFLSPVAALLPLLIGGLTIGISLGAVYGLVVVVQQGQINFAVPFLMILTMLGLAVDYSVLQLRRTREERTKGRSLEESVAVSVRWAGQAILTAGSTVVVAYIVLTVTNVPFFGSVGTAIAIGVAILLASSLTLMPALELMMGDRLFWPNRGRLTRQSSIGKGRLKKLAERTMQRRVTIAVVFTLLAAGSFYLAYQTPTGIDITKLIPNFESNQGLTAITNNLGGSVVSPTQVVVTFPSPIVYSQNQFNQSLLRQLDAISSTISNSAGVASVSGPTRPYGAPFNYTNLGVLSPPVRSQYLIGILSQIGKDNRTALITVGLSVSAESSNAVSDLTKIESTVNGTPLPAGTTVYFGGSTQSTIDALNLINGVLPLVVLILSLGVYFILFAQLRSVFTPARLIFTILCSVAFALALLSITFYYLLQTPVVSLAPLFVIVTMLGVGIDYDIFLVTRIREEAAAGMSDHDAIKTAVSKIWVTLLGLGLILSSVFASLAASGIGLLEEIGVSVASAIMVDVGLVILFFVPALMAIAQKYNWWPAKVRPAAEETPSKQAV